MRTGHRNTKQNTKQTKIWEIYQTLHWWKSKHLKLQIKIQQIIRKLRKNTAQKFQKYAKPVLSQLFTNTNLHRYLKHTHTLTHTRAQKCAVFYWYIPHRKTKLRVTDLPNWPLPIFGQSFDFTTRSLSLFLALPCSRFAHSHWIVPKKSLSLSQSRTLTHRK